MKRLHFAIVIAVAVLAACEGPVGPAGADGKNGIDGINGKDANSVCLTCHGNVTMLARTTEYELSKHFTGTTSARNTKYCARCHTNEGFLEVLGANKYVVSNDMPNATRISCTTCHKHSGFDFAVNANAQILRATDPVFLNYNRNTTVTDFGAMNNLCVNCHQIRGVTSVNYTDSTGAVKTFDQLPYFPFASTKDDNAPVNYQVGRSFSVHDGNQSNLFKGINGYEYNGQTYTRVWQHSSNNCTTCHMNKWDPVAKVGGHTLKPNVAECDKCHTQENFASTQAKVAAKLIELGDLLAARKVMRKTVNTSGVTSYSAMQTHDFYGQLFATTQTSTRYATALANANTVSPTTGLVIYGNTVTMATDANWSYRIGRPWKMGELGAAYNYAFINSELSFGVHNPVYAMQLLQKSIDWLKANP
ncbi:MAG TPA: hypothetical protein VFV33_14925 [Gemmatimonadaceae bacterium]|nr:hypothetical protein [Gemmatimonadaceae bacterium]